MNIEENHLLSCLSEECSEIIKNVCKAQRFGLDSTYKDETNRDKIISELNDFMGVVRILQEIGTLPVGLFDEDKMEAKRGKVMTYWEIANVGQQ